MIVFQKLAIMNNSFRVQFISQGVKYIFSLALCNRMCMQAGYYMTFIIYFMFYAFYRIPHCLYQRPRGLTNHGSAFYEHININTKTVACKNLL